MCRGRARSRRLTPPLREHALISTQEHEAWDVLLACQGQVRFAPSGHVIGMDMDAVLRLGAARGHDGCLLSELLPAPRPGVVEALFIDQGRSDEPLSAPAVSHSSTTLPLIRDALASLRLRSRRPGRLAATIATHMSFRMLRGSQRPSKGPRGTNPDFSNPKAG